MLALAISPVLRTRLRVTVMRHQPAPRNILLNEETNPESRLLSLFTKYQITTGTQGMG